MTSPALDAVAEGLAELGFKKRAGWQFTRELESDVLGWLGLNRATRHRRPGEVEVNPVVGIRHQGVERVVADLRGEKFHGYVPPTVSTPLGHLMPKLSHHRSWILEESDSRSVADDLVSSVAEYGVPFMESGSSLAELCRLLDQALGFDHQLAYRRPVAWALAGDAERAADLIDEAETGLGDRTDAAATELRAFVRAFRERFRASD